ncbi:hypothetical protein Nepgr_005360 [Nepenthes gracilis]|uniref:Uncharacterized protein n=1 Tax=Nepenthes gracilis TaxID=150966 RepID=A0AAD3S367_NEPGR|nr:hypothetical protein Nepgr_005360 [Nepenthes gracilis]
MGVSGLPAGSSQPPTAFGVPPVSAALVSPSSSEALSEIAAEVGTANISSKSNPAVPDGMLGCDLVGTHGAEGMMQAPCLSCFV